MPKPPKSEARPKHVRPDLGILLGLAYTSFVELLHVEMHARGFSDVKGNYGYVFRALADGPLSISALAGRLQITTQGVTKLANEMQRAGYVERNSDANDARVTTLTLSERGTRALAAARNFHTRYEKTLSAKLGAHTTQRLRTALAHIVETSTGDPAAHRTIRPF